MNVKTSPLIEKFIDAAENGHRLLGERKIASSCRERDKAGRMFLKIIGKGEPGLNEMLEIARGDKYAAAILACTLCYEYAPAQCRKNLKRISELGLRNYSMIAGGVMEFLRSSGRNTLKKGIRQ